MAAAWSIKPGCSALLHDSSGSLPYVLLAGLVAHILYGPGGIDFGVPDAVFEDGIYQGLLIGSALICGARAILVREERLPWALIGVALVTWSAADLFYSAVLAKLDQPPFPSASDAGWLFFYPAVWTAVALLMRRRIREFHPSLWLDGLVGALGMAACVAALVLPPILAMSVQGDTAAVAVNLAYPAGDLLLVGLLVGALALTGWRPDLSISSLGLGVLLSAVGDLSYLDAVAHGSYAVPAWAASMWPASALLTAIAAWQPIVQARPLQLEGRRLLVLPLVAMIAALGLLFVDHFERISGLAAALAFATLCVAGVRLWLTLGEHMTLLGTSRGEATTDPLTGLRNRRALANDLEEEMVDASSEHPLLLLLFDLNGFKAYNDVYGHPAGDALLTRLGLALTQAVGGRGHAYRMGGDEFCVLTAAAADQHADLAACTRAALSERGDGFVITAALGSATIDSPGSDPANALLDADRRMYAEKNSLRGSAGGQSAAVLLRVLSERHPDLGDHVDSVADADRQGRARAPLTSEDQTALLQAAALHDIGKGAVPDAILDKPGPLDAREWAFMRRTRSSANASWTPPPRWPTRRGSCARRMSTRRQRPSGPARRRRHPPGGPHHRRLRRLRRDGLGPAIPARHARRAGFRGALPVRGHAVRPGCRRSLRPCAHDGRRGRRSTARPRRRPSGLTCRVALIGGGLLREVGGSRSAARLDFRVQRNLGYDVPENDPTHGRPAVLVVDDDAGKRLAVRAMLTRLGHPVVEVDSGREALRAVAAQHFAVILMDVRMPSMSGYDTARLIRERSSTAATPIIFMTAFGHDETEVAAANADGAVDFIFAPIAADALRAKVTAFVDLFAQAREHQGSLDALTADNAPLPDGEGRARAVLQNVADGIVTVDDQGLIESANRSAQGLFGYQEDELIGQPLRLIIAPDRYERFAQAAEALPAEPIETLGCRRDRSQFAIEIGVREMQVGEGACTIAAVRDITERAERDKRKRRDARALRREAQADRIVFEEAPTGSVITGRDGRIERVNLAVCTMLGHTPERFSGAHFLEFAHPENRDDGAAAVAALMGGASGVQHFETRYLHTSGRVIEARVALTAIRDDEDEVAQLFAQIEDVTAARCAARELEQAQFEMLARLAAAAESSDDDTGQHTLRVADLSVAIARAIGLPEADIDMLRLAAPLHDVGKLAISDAVLRKRGKLTNEEFEQVKTHTTAGALMLSGSRFELLALAEQTALTHHERWDGSGYPAGLAGVAIPITGRIVAVADVFDALTHSRPYQDAWSTAEAIAEMTSQAGRHFDPVVVDAFLSAQRPH